METTNLPIKKWEKATETRISYDSNTGERREDVSRWIAIKDEKQGLPVNVCLVHESILLSKEQVEANENMIAAAPCLFESLSWAMKRIDKLARHSALEGDAELYEFAKALSALKKARGEHE